MDRKDIIGWSGVGAVIAGTVAIVVTGFGDGGYIEAIVGAVVVVLGAIFAKKN